MASRSAVSSGRSDRDRRAKVEALRLAQQRTARRRRLLTALVALVAAAVILTVVLTHRSATPAAVPPPAGAGTGLPPWPAPIDPAAGEQAAGLVVNPMEGAVQHFHAHLDILVDGRPVTVPANLGIDLRQQLIAELHTHDDLGILHVEASSPTATFTLGQLFSEWGVKLDAQDLGGLRTGDGKQLRTFVDGRPHPGDPSSIQLADHQEIALVFGTGTPSNVPASYDFAAHNL